MKIATRRAANGVLALTVTLLLALPALAAHAGKVDPFWRVQKTMTERQTSSGKSSHGAPFFDVFIRSSDMEMTKGRVAAAGGSVHTTVGRIITASLPEAALAVAESWGEVEYVEAGKPMRQHNDMADADTGVDLVHAGTGFTRAYDGTGVIVGIIDSGIDLTHPAFLDASGESRVLFVWDQEDATGPGPAEIGSTYGTEYDHEAIVAGATSQQDTIGHGTHVAGIAAGRDDLYPGVASGAQIVVVKNTTMGDGLTDPLSTTVSDAAYYIFEKARQLGLPAVINISLGTHYGPHDGTSLFDQYLDGLVAGAAGRAVVVCAGNSANPGGYYTAIGNHIGYAVTSAQDAGSFIICGGNPYPYPYIIELWEETDCTEQLAIGLWSDFRQLSESNAVAVGGSESGFLASWIAYSIDRTVIDSPLNGKRYTQIAIWPDESFFPGNYSFDLRFSGDCSALNAWVQPYSAATFGYGGSLLGGVEYRAGDSISTVMSPGTASNVVAVGSYVTRANWVDSTGASWTDTNGFTNVVSFFSSRGPALATAQGTKPNLAAPGSYIISAYSSTFSDPVAAEIIDANHYAMRGTSMSSPHVAGIVALLFQAAPTLTVDQVTAYLQSSARADDSVGAVPNADWGYGKVDADAALAAVLVDFPPAPGGDDSGGGCHLASGLSLPAGGLALAFVLSSLAVVVIRRRRVNRTADG